MEKKLATISKVLLTEPKAVKLQTEDGAENVIMPVTGVRIIMENGAMWEANFPSFICKTKEDVINIYMNDPNVFKKLEITSNVPK